jgi:hypothetical protein
MTDVMKKQNKYMTKRTLGAASLVLASILAAPQGNAAALADFQFNEGPNSVTTTSRVNGLVGSLGQAEVPENEPTVTTDTPSQQAGDKALSLTAQQNTDGTFQNTGGFLIVDDSTNPVLNSLLTGPFTMEAWIKPAPEDLRSLEGIMGYGSTLKMGLMNNGELVFTLFGIVDIRSGVYVSYGTWQHVAVVWEPGVGVTFYLDGNPTFVAETRLPGAPGTSFLSVGAEQLANSFIGSMDRVRVHTAALTAEQLDTVAATPKAPLPSTAVAYNFSENAAPFASSATAVRPAISSVPFIAQRSRPQWVTNTPSGATNDYALNFTSGTYVLVPDAPSVIAFNPEDPDFTMEAWVKPEAQPGSKGVIYYYNGPGGAFSFAVTADRKVMVTTLGRLDIGSQATIPNDGNWHHIAAVHEHGQEVRFYVDGVLGDTIAYNMGMLIGERTETEIVIGGEGRGLGNPYRGALDRVRISNEALRVDQLDYLAVPGVTPGAPELAIATVVEVSWPTVPAGYTLQSTMTVEDASSWTAVTNTPLVMEGKYKIYAPTSNQKTYYRLVK